jgi:two-component system, OmpR family, phosphate regulon sensor histidine kinase PhoR
MNLTKKYFIRIFIILLIYTIALALIFYFFASTWVLILFSAILFLILTLSLYFFLQNTFKPLAELDDLLKKLLKKENFSFLNLNKFHNFNNISRNLEEIDYLLKKYESKLSSHKEGFYNVIDTINEAMWMQDSKGVITVCNRKFSDLIKTAEPAGEYFWNVIQNYNLYQFVDAIFQKPQNYLKEIEIEKSHYLCSASYSLVSGMVVFILYNVTEIKKLEMLKKDFVLNISHELRTPLTSIKGFLETLEPELKGEQVQYLKIIKRNTDRLIRIVQDLLTLSQLEHDHSLEIETIQTEDICKQLQTIFEPKTREKGIELILLCSTELKKFKADKFKLEQVFINLLDNAVKYTEAGKISFKISHTPTTLIFEISDTGIGIPQEHQERIFERFYVVNKSRARKYGSTGLGLSIVKHIVNLHGGKITLKSSSGSGTTIHISIPQDIHE